MSPSDGDAIRVLLACGRGELPVNVALMRLISCAHDPAEVDITLEHAIELVALRGACAESGRIQQVRRLWRDTPQAWPKLRAVVTPAADATEGTAKRWAAVFDRAVAISPEASVALYSLGRPDLLARATDEIMDLMLAWKLLGAGRRAIEIGCGIGRFLAPVARTGTLAVGIDVSTGMLREARRRCRGVAGAWLIQTGGADLACIGDSRAELVYAIDVFPYLVDSGLAATHVAEAARVLKPRGTLLVMNWSYRGDLAADRGEIARLAASIGLTWVDRPVALSHWDGKIYRLEKPA